MTASEEATIERYFQIFYDIKKTLHYKKSTGDWSWSDRDESDNLEAWHTGFATALDAIYDAVEPYLEEDETVPL